MDCKLEQKTEKEALAAVYLDDYICFLTFYNSFIIIFVQQSQENHGHSVLF